MPVLCGGTGLYVESVVNGVRLPEVPENTALRTRLKGRSLAELTEMLSRIKVLHNTTDVDSCQRAIRAIEIQMYYREHPDEAVLTEPHPMKNVTIVGVDIDRENRRRRITTRLASSLHSAEPCHLTFGKLMNRNLKLGNHIVILKLSGDIQRQIFILKPVIYQVVRLYSSINKRFDLVHHTFVKTFFQSCRYAATTILTIDVAEWSDEALLYIGYRGIWDNRSS